jgi:ribosomal protein S18 acetylase RimI-like enzyme
MECRYATSDDVSVLAQLNQRLIRDEGHRNLMTLPELEQRMSEWLRGEYEAVLFERGGEVLGYALYRRQPDHVYLRQLFVRPEFRRQGVGQAALDWLRSHAWAGAPRIRLDVLVHNVAAIRFWRAVGFQDYCITMELEHPDGS